LEKISVTKFKQKSGGFLKNGHFKNVQNWKIQKSLEKYPQNSRLRALWSVSQKK
jgi:hypothetical protein